jgi:aspartate kinase
LLAHDPLGRVTTLGRGGSDLTATAIGAALLVDEVQVLKDLDGKLTFDPRMVHGDARAECLARRSG